MDLHKSGLRCNNLLQKFKCLNCEEKNVLCNAVRKVECLELEYYKLTILEMIILYKKKLEELPDLAKKRDVILPEQGSLFKF